MDTLLQDKSEIIQRLLYLDKTDDKHFMKKIVELYNDGIDEQTLQSIFWQRYEIEDWLRDKSLEGKDYIALYKENEKGIFRSTIYKTEDVKQVWLSTIVDEDDDITINKPNSFEEAHMLGMEGWCFCDNEGYWIQHTTPTNQDGLGETIYFIHNVMQSNPDDYTTDMVKMDGGHEILNRKHHHLDVPQYLMSIGDMANKLVPTLQRINKKESITKQDTDMKTENRKRNVVRLTESQLKQMIAESVKKVLNESELEPYFSHKNNEWEKDYFNDALLLIRGIENNLTAMEEGGNPMDMQSTEYLYREAEQRLKKLNDIFPLIRKMYFKQVSNSL